MHTDIKPMTPCRVHFNLRTGAWVIRLKTAKGWRKASDARECTITHATPVVSTSGVTRIRAQKQREVIACIAGLFQSYTSTPDACAEHIHFNPYRRHDFHQRDGTSYVGSNVAIFPPNSPTFLAK
jgi:hypothetical protein